MIKVCQLCNAIYAPITYIFSSVVLHQKWLKLPLPVESRLKKNRKKVEQSALERCERVKELFSRVSHPAEKSKKEDLSLSAGFCFRSNSENVFISRMNSSRKKTYLEIHPKLRKKSSKFNPKMETQPKSNILEIHSKYLKKLKILGIDVKKVFESVWAGWELKRGLINITWSYISKCHVCGSRKKVFPRSSHLSTRTTRSRFFRNSVECGNCTLVDVV